MKEISRRKLMVLIGLFFLITLVGQVMIYRAVFTGRAAEGEAAIFIYPRGDEVTNCTSTVTTVGNSVTLDNSAKSIGYNATITTTAAANNQLFCVSRYNSNLQAPNGVAGKTFVRTYYINGSNALYNNLNQLTISLYYQDAWLAANGQNEATLDIYYWNGANWIGMSTVDTVNNYARGTAPSFGYFGIFAGPAGGVQAAGGGGGDGEGGGDGGPPSIAVQKSTIAAKIVEILEPATKTISATAAAVAKVAAPVTKKYWPVLALASLLAVGLIGWVVRRRHHLK